jgi:16S rRNA processing protein RimM
VLVARIEGIGPASAAEALNGVELYVERALLPEPDDEDDFYHADLIGLERPAGRRHDHRHGDGDPQFRGRRPDRVRNRRRSGDTFLYPFTKAVVPEVHVADGYLVIDPPIDADPGEEEPD